MRVLPIIAALCLIGCNKPPTDKGPPKDGPTDTDTTTDTDTVDFAEQAMEYFATHVQESLDESGVPGASLAVVFEGQIYTATLGIRRIGNDSSVEEHTPFLVGSMTKTVLVAAILQLMDDGAFALDTKLDSLVPGTVTDGTFDEDIELRHLLTHSSGFPPFFEFGCNDAAEPLGDWLTRMEPLDVWVAPDTLFSYSNSGFGLVARSAEVATGDPYEQIVTELVFDPVGMVNSSYVTPGTERAYGHVGPPWSSTQTDDFDCASVRAAGGIWGTATDMALFAQAIMDGTLPHTDRYLSEAIPTGRGEDIDYGFGIFKEPYRGLEIASHGGSVNGYGAAFTLVPAEDFAVVTLLNGFTVAGDPFEIGKSAIDFFLQPGGGLPTINPDPDLWETWAGDYTAMSGGILQASVVDDEMQVAVPAQGVEMNLPYDAGQTFRVSDDGILRVTFWMDDSGQPEWMSTPWGIGAWTP